MATAMEMAKSPYRDDSLDSDDIDHTGLLASEAEKGQANASMPPQSQQPQHHEDTVSMNKKLWYLLGYFICNIGLTLYNKAILGSFNFPWLLTALHAGCSSIGCSVMLQLGYFHSSKLTQRENLALIAFSLLFTINIAISNVSLAMVSVPFHQVVRATTPLFTTLLFRILYNRTFSTHTYLSLLPIVLGVTLAVYGDDFRYTDLGFILTFLGVILAAFKTIITNRMMTGSLALSFWEILLRMSPLAFIQSLIYAYFTGELSRFTTFVSTDLFSPTTTTTTTTPLRFICILLGNGFLAFALNVSSFSTNKVAGALTMTVCANIKQCLTIVLGILLFNVRLNMLNLWGILITVLGGVGYSVVELDGKRRRKEKEEAAAVGAARAGMGTQLQQGRR